MAKRHGREKKRTAYKIQSRILRRALRGLRGWNCYPRSEEEETLFLQFYCAVTDAATVYARKVARRAVDSIGKDLGK